MATLTEELAVNDIVRFSRVFRVTRVGDDEVHGVDEKLGMDVHFYTTVQVRGTGKIELLHRPRRKPALHTKLSMRDIRDTMWKAGTIFLLDHADGVKRPASVTQDGLLWVSELMTAWTFDEAVDISTSNGHAKLHELIYLP